MSSITVSQKTFSITGVANSSPVLKIYAHRSFIDSTGAIITQGRFPTDSPVVSVTCSISSGVLTVPQFTIYSTSNSNNTKVRYKAYLVKEGTTDQRLPFFLNRFKIPHGLGSPITWTDIYNYGADQEAPTTPTTFDLSALTATSIRASWGASTDVGTGVKEYQITLSYQ